jgi:hypothetical protein
MANALAIAAVTAVLRDLLNDGLINGNLDSLGQFSVTSLPPDRIEPDPEDPANRLNLFMWHASRNAPWSLERLPARDRAGNRIDSPFLALDLHFILTATGADDLHAEILLGYGMQILHETPVLTRAAIRAALAGANPPLDASLLPQSMQMLAASDLADQFEQIRITAHIPKSEPIEALSNLWSAFSAPMRASALYQVSAVLIENRRPVRSALPVLTLGGRTAPIRAPRIERIIALPNGPGTIPDPMAAILPGSWIAATGTALLAEDMRLLLGTRVLAPLAANLGDLRMDVQLPNDLLAGLNRLLVEHRFTPQGAAQSRLWEASNAAPMIITPVLQNHVVAGAVATGRFAGTVTVTLAHPVAPDQIVALLFNPLPGGAEPAFALPCRRRNAQGTQVVADLADITPGQYVLRVEVNGAASLPTMGAQGFDAPLADLT